MKQSFEKFKKMIQKKFDMIDKQKKLKNNKVKVEKKEDEFIEIIEKNNKKNQNEIFEERKEKQVKNKEEII